MPFLLLVLFVIVPLIELAVIIQVGQMVGAWWTIGLLVLDSVVGAFIVRAEGRRAWRAFRGALEAGRWPGHEVVQGALILVGGALLLTPGFVTDVVGLLTVLSPTRGLIARGLQRRLVPAPVGFAEERIRARRERARAGSSGEVFDVEVVSIERLESDDVEAHENDELLRREIDARRQGDADDPPPGQPGS